MGRWAGSRSRSCRRRGSAKVGAEPPATTVVAAPSFMPSMHATCWALCGRCREGRCKQDSQSGSQGAAQRRCGSHSVLSRAARPAAEPPTSAALRRRADLHPAPAAGSHPAAAERCAEGCHPGAPEGPPGHSHCGVPEVRHGRRAPWTVVGVRVWRPGFLEPLTAAQCMHRPDLPSAALRHALAGAWATWTLPAWHAGSPTSTITLRSTLWVGALPELQQSRMLYLPCPVGCTPWPAFTGSANPRDVGRYAACLKSPTAAASCRRPSQGALPRWPAVRRLRARLVRGLHL